MHVVGYTEDAQTSESPDMKTLIIADNESKQNIAGLNGALSTRACTCFLFYVEPGTSDWYSIKNNSPMSIVHYEHAQEVAEDIGEYLGYEGPDENVAVIVANNEHLGINNYRMPVCVDTIWARDTTTSAMLGRITCD